MIGLGTSGALMAGPKARDIWVPRLALLWFLLAPLLLPRAARQPTPWASEA